MKLKDDNIGASDISEYLKDAQDDFLLEIDVFRACKAMKWHASHGGTYNDPVTNKTRQFDVRVLIDRNIDDRVLTVLGLAIECKNLRSNHPLIIYRVPREADESFHEIAVSPIRKGLCTAPVEGLLGIQRVGENHTVYEKYRYVGKKTAQVGRALSGQMLSDDSEVFDKWSQAVSSSYDLAWIPTQDKRPNVLSGGGQPNESQSRRMLLTLALNPRTDPHSVM